MKITSFPLPVLKLREHLQKLSLWPVPSQRDKIFFSDVKESYHKAILESHPDSRTISKNNSVAVHEIVEAYKQLTSCFAVSNSADKSELFIHKSSLIEFPRFSQNKNHRVFQGGRFAHKDDWDTFLNHSPNTHSYSTPKSEKARKNRFYNVRSSTVPQNKSTLQYENKPLKSDAFSTSSVKRTYAKTMDDDTGCWYSKDVMR